MAQAIGDPDELERFAYSLQQFIDSLNDAVGSRSMTCSTCSSYAWSFV